MAIFQKQGNLSRTQRMTDFVSQAQTILVLISVKCELFLNSNRKQIPEQTMLLILQLFLTSPPGAFATTQVQHTLKNYRKMTKYNQIFPGGNSMAMYQWDESLSIGI